jgi:hypothetical protein
MRVILLRPANDLLPERRPLSSVFPKIFLIISSRDRGPNGFFQSDEEDEMKQLLFGSLDILENDLQKNLFETFTPWVTRTGINIENIREALIYLHHHEGLHTGIIYSMKRMVQK